MATDFISHLNWFSLLNISTFGIISLVCGTRLWGARALRCTFHSTSINWRSNLFLRLLKFYDNFPHRFISRTIRSAECVEWMRERREKSEKRKRSPNTHIDWFALVLQWCKWETERERIYFFFVVVRCQKSESTIGARRSDCTHTYSIHIECVSYVLPHLRKNQWLNVIHLSTYRI